MQGLLMTNGNGQPTPGELARSYARIEALLGRMEQVGEERHNTLLAQIADVRHRVVNLETVKALSDGFHQRVGKLFDRVEDLEKSEMKDRAVDEFKSRLRITLMGGSVIGAVVVVLQIISLMKGSP